MSMLSFYYAGLADHTLEQLHQRATLTLSNDYELAQRQARNMSELKETPMQVYRLDVDFEKARPAQHTYIATHYLQAFLDQQFGLDHISTPFFARAQAALDTLSEKHHGLPLLQSVFESWLLEGGNQYMSFVRDLHVFYAKAGADYFFIQHDPEQPHFMVSLNTAHRVKSLTVLDPLKEHPPHSVLAQQMVYQPCVEHALAHYYQLLIKPMRDEADFPIGNRALIVSEEPALLACFHQGELTLVDAEDRLAVYTAETIDSLWDQGKAGWRSASGLPTAPFTFDTQLEQVARERLQPALHAQAQPSSPAQRMTG